MQKCHVFCVNTHQHVQSERQNNLHNPSEPRLSARYYKLTRVDERDLSHKV